MGTDVQSREIGSPAVTRAIVRLAAQGLECGVDRGGRWSAGRSTAATRGDGWADRDRGGKTRWDEKWLVRERAGAGRAMLRG